MRGREMQFKREVRCRGRQGKTVAQLETRKLHPGVFILNLFLGFWQPAEDHVQKTCFGKWARQTYKGQLGFSCS